MKVLIVDDEKLTREGLRDKIDWTGLGFTDVRCADDGLHGLEIGRQFRPDVILTDVRMPKLNGIQMSEQIQQLCPESSIIIMSGYSDKEYLKAAIRLRAVSYVEKPISLDGKSLSASMRSLPHSGKPWSVLKMRTGAAFAAKKQLHLNSHNTRTREGSSFLTRHGSAVRRSPSRARSPFSSETMTSVE